MCANISRQGVAVAVAYQSAFFIGEVVEIKSEDKALIQFIEAGYANKFSWPSVLDTDVVDSKYVFQADFSVINKGRYCEVPDFQVIKKQYELYKKLFFWLEVLIMCEYSYQQLSRCFYLRDSKLIIFDLLNL